MKTFDYAAAWRHEAGPAYRALPAEIHALLAATNAAAEKINQAPDCSMPWPKDGGTLRAAFEAVDSATLAHAAETIYNAGHWYPGQLKAEGHPAPPGITWKFSHYADQVLRGRLGLPESGDRNHGNGFGLSVHEGRVRVWYSSRDMWTWLEVAPATVDGANEARRIITSIQSEIANATTKDERENRIYKAMEALRPPSRFMCEEGDQEELPAEVEERTRQALAIPGKQRAAVLEHYENATRKATEERDAMLWLLDHGLSTENWIYYSHTKTLSAGWRTPCGPVLVSRILDVISDYPGAYEIKTADGRKLTNADAAKAPK